jgi:hypothetical protein
MKRKVGRATLKIPNMSTDRIVFFKLCHATEATKINKLHLKQVYIIMLNLAKQAF